MTESLTHRMQSFYRELGRRRVFRAAALYVVVFWPVIQVVDILSPALELPDVTMRYLLITFLAGLPVMLILSWLFDLNRGGLTRAAPVEIEDATTPADRAPRGLITRQLERVIIGMLLVVIVVLAVMQRSAVDTADPEATAPDAIQSIAVLPFVSFSAGADDQFFSDGLTEELLNVLAALPGLRVTARTTSFAYRGVNRNVQEIGRELNVNAILEGSVRRNDVDDTVRITAQLIDVATGAHVWSQTFDREFKDLFRIQDEIAAAVTGQMRLTLAATDTNSPARSQPSTAKAMIVYSMAQAELSKRTTQGIADAVRFFERALAEDPDYGDAHAGLANAYALTDPDPQTPDPLALAQASVSRALELDPGSANAWAVQGLIHMQRNDADAARETLEKALAANPSHAMANMWYGSLQSDRQLHDEYHRRAFELDPRSPVAGYNVAHDLISAGRDTEAMEVFSQIIAADPHYPRAYQLVAEINESRGRLDEAIRHYRHVYELDPRSDVATRIAELYIDIGEFEIVDEWLNAAADGLPANRRLDLEWLKIGSMVARGRRADAEALMKPLIARSPATREESLHTATAAYYLGDHQTTVEVFEYAKPLIDRLDRQLEWEDPSDAAIAFAYAFQLTEQPQMADAILTNLATQLDRLMDNPGRTKPDLWYTRARVEALRGNDNLALIHLQRAIDEGWRQHWRPSVEPCLERLLPNPSLQSMMAGLSARMDIMREALAFNDAFASD